MTRTTTIEIAPKPAPGELPDAALLDRFLARRDESAFEELVRRHGPGVLRTCRRRLGAGQDADDAFQATFIVLIRRADAIRRVDDVGAWLRGVARRVSLRARMRADRDRKRKGAAVDVGEVAGPSEPGFDDLGPALRAEVERLPEKYRRPVELCYWEGLSNDQAAERLDCPAGTVKWRLSRARELLRGRFVRRGIAMSALLLLRRNVASASMTPGRGPGGRAGGGGEALPDSFVRSTVALATLVRDTPGLFPPGPAAGPAAGAKGRGRKPGRSKIGLVPMIATLAALFLSISALAIALPTEAEKKAARFHAHVRSDAPRAAARDAELREEMKQHCPGEAGTRHSLSPSSAAPKGSRP